MVKSRCSAVTKAGRQCSRKVRESEGKYCFQHLSSIRAIGWKENITGIAAAVTAADVVVRAAELSISYLPTILGYSTGKSDAAGELKDIVKAGKQSDWVDSETARSLDARMDSWFSDLSEEQQSRFSSVCDKNW